MIPTYYNETTGQHERVVYASVTERDAWAMLATLTGKQGTDQGFSNRTVNGKTPPRYTVRYHTDRRYWFISEREAV